ncbi:MAG: site-specific DNA-methyltransferase [Rhodanobacter sp.]|nr:site-specific DNA-methyltransferase [Rhodanobacter sp.]
MRAVRLHALHCGRLRQHHQRGHRIAGAGNRGNAMPELYFKGKEFVYNHHLTVPFRPLVPDPAKSCGDDPDNLIIQGDNLQALKSLLPRYAGKVDLVFIDPPYNTGNEGWAYNDNVNSPLMKEWLDGNPVNAEDMLRHDKWLCMMWPRLKLLHELLSEHGIMFVTIDDHEGHRLESMLEEVFGSQSNLGRIVARLNPKGRHLDKFFAKTHEYVLVFAKDARFTALSGAPKTEKMIAEYKEEDADGRYRLLELRNRNSAFNPKTRPNLYFPLYVSPKTGDVSTKRDSAHTGEALPLDSKGEPTCWTWSIPKVEADRALLVGRKTGDGGWRVFRKDYLQTEDGADSTTKPKTIWLDANLNMDLARKTVSEVMGRNAFDFPKPVALIQKLIELVPNQDALILDSFGGSGTTAHAVLAQNAKDGGNRKFILVECEAYADTLTAERVRRVIEGYQYTGTQHEELLREKLTFSKLKQANKLLEQVALVEKQNDGRFDAINSTVKDGELIVTGEKAVKKRAEGLGGGFTYCTLGDKLELDDLLTGKSLPAFAAFGGYLFHTATGQPLDAAKVREADGYLGESAQYHVWLVYKPDLDFLKSRDAALTLALAEKIAATDKDKPHLVFAPARFVPQKKLLELGVEHAPLPYALYRIEKD